MVKFQLAREDSGSAIELGCQFMKPLQCRETWHLFFARKEIKNQKGNPGAYPAKHGKG
jgi:hypothetical protein